MYLERLEVAHAPLLRLGFVGAVVCAPLWMMWLAYCYISGPWHYWMLLLTSYSATSLFCTIRLLNPAYYEWRQPPVVQLNAAAPANVNAANLQRGRLLHLTDLPRMLTDVFQWLARVGLDACQQVSRQFRDAIEDDRTSLPLYLMSVDLSPSTPLVEYGASIRNVGSVTGHFFLGLRRCDLPYFRNAVISLRGMNGTYARTSTDMISAFVRWLNLDERNVCFEDVQCDVYGGELEDLFRLTDRYKVAELCVIYKRSLITPGCDFLSTLFAEARKRSLGWLTVSLANVEANNCDIELQVGLHVLREIFEDEERPSAGHLMVIVPRLKGFRFLRRIYQAYARREITRPLTIGCDARVSLAELRASSAKRTRYRRDPSL